MDLSVVFLGTGGSVPTARRATACVLVRRGGERLLFDCGEGAQRQMHRSTGLIELDEGEAVVHDGYAVHAYPVEHRIRAYGYALVEDDRPGRFDPVAAERLGIEPGPAFGALQRGHEV